MAISYNTGTTSIITSGTAGGHTFTIPGGVLSGDTILVLVMCFTTATGTIAPTLSSSATTPIQLSSSPQSSVGGGISCVSGLWSIAAGSSDPSATLTFGATGGSGGSYWYNVGLVSYTGAGGVDVNAGNETYGASGDSGSITTPSATTLTSGDWQVQLIGAGPPNGNGFTIPGSLTSREVIGTGANAGLLLNIADSNGSVGPAGTSIGNTLWSCGSASSQAWDTSFTVGLKPPTTSQPTYAPANPGKTWKRRFNTPERMSLPYNQTPYVETSPALEVYGFGTFPAIYSDASIESVTVSVTEYQSSASAKPLQIQLWDYSGPVPVQIGSTVTAPVFTSSNIATATFGNVYYGQLATLRVRIYAQGTEGTAAEDFVDSVGLTVNYIQGAPPYSPVAQIANPGRTWRRRFNIPERMSVPYHASTGVSANVNGLVANVNVAAPMGSVYASQVFTATPANPGRTWHRRFDGYHEVPTYNVGISANVIGLTATATVAAPMGSVYAAQVYTATPASPGKTWLRKFRPHQTVPIYNSETSVNLSALENAISQDDPYAWWKLNEPQGSTTAIDYSGNGWTATNAGGVEFGVNTTPDASGTTAYINGSNPAYLTTTMNPSFSEGISLEAWINAADFQQTIQSGQTQVRVISNSTSAVGNHAGFELRFNNTPAGGSALNNVTMAVANGTATQSDAGIVPLSNGWNHIVGTWDGTTVNVYLNGVNVKTAAFAGPLKTVGNGNVTIGSVAGGTQAWMTGFLSNVVMYDYALSATRVQAHYNAGNSSPNGAQSVIAQQATPGRTWKRHYRPVRQVETYTAGAVVSNVNFNGLVANVNVAANFGSVYASQVYTAEPIAPGRTWIRRFALERHQTPRWVSVTNVNGLASSVNVQAYFGSVYSSTITPYQPITPGRTWIRRFAQERHQTPRWVSVTNVNGITANVNVAANFGSVYSSDVFTAPTVAAGKTWLRRYRKHQVLPYRSAPNINIAGITANVNVTANFGSVYAAQVFQPAPVNPGIVWKRRYRRHVDQWLKFQPGTNISGNVSNVSVQAYFGSITAPQQQPLIPVQPGRTWIRRYRRHVIRPGLQFQGANIIGLVANVNVVAPTGSVYAAQAIPMGPVKAGRVWLRRFTHRHETPSWQSATTVYGLTSHVNVVANFGSLSDTVPGITSQVNVACHLGTPTGKISGIVSQVNVQSYFGTVIALKNPPLPLTINPGRTWKRRYRRHQTLPYVAAIIKTGPQSVQGQVAAASVSSTVSLAITVSARTNVNTQAQFGAVYVFHAVPAVITVQSHLGTGVTSYPNAVITWGTKLQRPLRGRLNRTLR